jgi:hypothetical protein
LNEPHMNIFPGSIARKLRLESEPGQHNKTPSADLKPTEGAQVFLANSLASQHD